MSRATLFTGMEPGSHRMLVEAQAGAMEVLADVPSGPLQGWVIVAHPQPLLGGSASHKVPHLLARAFQQNGWLALRPNFRGVGASKGDHAQGVGETDDIVEIANLIASARGGLPLALVGFSFGAFVQSRVAHSLAQAGQPAARVVLAGLPAGTVEGGRDYQPMPPLPGTLVVHGERDERVPLSTVLHWCGTHDHAVMVVPGADHFFTGKLPLLRELALAHLRSVLSG